MAVAEPMRRGTRWALIIGLSGAAASLGILSGFARDHALLINISPSLPYWALWVDRTAIPKRGDLIVFMPPRSDLLEAHFGHEPHPFGKRVWGLPGDRVSVSGRIFYIGERPVAVAKPVSRTGEPLALGPTGIIPRGCYFVGTEHKDGFDSRYAAIGWICGPAILGTARPVL